MQEVERDGAAMRTTVNIDAELLAAATLRAARTPQTIGSVIEDALRRTLLDSEPEADVAALPDCSSAGGLRSGVDLCDKDAIGALLGERSR